LFIPPADRKHLKKLVAKIKDPITFKVMTAALRENPTKRKKCNKKEMPLAFAQSVAKKFARFSSLYSE
jgi:hypothetical protein